MNNTRIIKITILQNLLLNKINFQSKEFISIERCNNKLFDQIERKCQDFLIAPSITSDLPKENGNAVFLSGVENHVEVIFPWITLLPPCYGIAFEVWLDHDTAILVTSTGGISSIFISLCGPIGVLLGALVATQSIILGSRIGPNGIHFLGVIPIVGIPAFPYIDWAEPL